MKTRNRTIWISRAVGLAIATLLVGCSTLSPFRKDEPEKEWATRTRDNASELSKYTGSSQQTNWDSLPNTPPK